MPENFSGVSPEDTRLREDGRGERKGEGSWTQLAGYPYQNFSFKHRRLTSSPVAPRLKRHQRALCMQRIRNPTSWTPSRFRSMCRPVRFRSCLLFGPESHTSKTSTSPLHAKDLQPDFVDVIPISVYVPAGKVPIEAPRSAVFKDLAHLGISKLQAWCAICSGVALGPGRAPHAGCQRPLLVLCAELSQDCPYGGVKKNSPPSTLWSFGVEK